MCGYANITPHACVAYHHTTTHTYHHCTTTPFYTPYHPHCPTHTPHTHHHFCHTPAHSPPPSALTMPHASIVYVITPPHPPQPHTPHTPTTRWSSQFFCEWAFWFGWTCVGHEVTLPPCLLHYLYSHYLLSGWHVRGGIKQRCSAERKK